MNYLNSMFSSNSILGNDTMVSFAQSPLPIAYSTTYGLSSNFLPVNAINSTVTTDPNAIGASLTVIPNNCNINPMSPLIRGNNKLFYNVYF